MKASEFVFCCSHYSIIQSLVLSNTNPVTSHSVVHVSSRLVLVIDPLSRDVVGC